MLFEDVAALYFAGKNHRSKARDKYSFNRLSLFFRHQCVTKIRRQHVRAYVDARTAQGVTLSTVRRELRFASAAVNYVRLEHELDLPNPFQKLNIPEAESRTRWITKEQAARLIASASLYAKTPHLPCFIKLALHTGCRRGELLALEWSRVDLGRRLVLLEARHTKTAKRRSVPLNDVAALALGELLQWRDIHHPCSPWVFPSSAGGHIRWLKTGFRGACDRAGIDDFRIHDLRHTCASWLVIAGVDLYVVRDLLGHSSVTTTEKYAHLAPARLASAVALLN